jgi:hypothetical protein
MMMLFEQLMVGDHFFVNGNHYTKKSSRTATMMEVCDIHTPTRCWFYFGMKEIVKKL